MKTRKVQYYESDLSRLLGIGNIVDMHIAWTNGTDGARVLRIECENTEKPETGYETIRAPARKAPAAKSRPERKQTPKPVQKPAARPAEPSKVGSLLEKVAVASKDFFLNPERNKGKREMFGGGSQFGDGHLFGDNRWDGDGPFN